MRPVLVLLTLAAAAGATQVQAQPRYLTWPGKTEAVSAPVGLSPGTRAETVADPALQLGSERRGAEASNPAVPPPTYAADRYGPRLAAPRPAAEPIAYAAPTPAAPMPTAPAARPTIYDPVPPPPPAPEPEAAPQPTPDAQPQPAPAAPAPANRQTWSAGRGEGQGVPSRTYSVQRETERQAQLDPAFFAAGAGADLAEPPPVEDRQYVHPQTAQTAPPLTSARPR